MTDYFSGARALGLEDDGALQQTQAPAAMDYFSGARNLDMPQQASLDTGGAGRFSPGQTPMQIPEKPPRTWGDTAVDVAKSGGIGIAQGGLGFATLPGNLEMLGRMGIDKAAGVFGFQPNTVAGQKLPHYGDAKRFAEGYTGKFYEPQTTIGKYARSVGEFAPLLASRGMSGPGKILSVLGGGVASEAAGQATEGTALEPWARMAGGIAGSMGPTMATRAVSPSPVDSQRLNSLAVLDREGVKALTAGQRTDSTPLKWMEAATQDIPFAAKRAKALQTDSADQFTRATLKRAGINADRATPEVMNGAFERLGAQFDDMAARSTFSADDQFSKAMTKALVDYDRLTPSASHAPVVKEFAEDFGRLIQQQRANPAQPVMMGDAYQKWRHDLTEYIRDAQRADAGSQLPKTLLALREAMDDAVERGLPKAAKAEFAKTRREYKNLVTIEKAASGAGRDAVEGVISPAALRTATKTGNLRDYTRGRDDLSELARAGVSVMSPLPQSGTTPRAMATNALSLGLGVGGTATFGWPGIALAAAPQVTSRALMHPWTQAYLGNQLAAPVHNMLAAGRPSLSSHTYVAGPMMFDDRRNALMP